MNLVRRYNAVAVMSAAIGFTLLSSVPSFASWELRIYTDRNFYNASYSNQCSGHGSDCSPITMCGKVVYVSGAPIVVDSYRRGNEVRLLRAGGDFNDPLCTAQQ